MILYHAGFLEIRKPDVFHGRKNADFGQGFYMTPDRDFAMRWAKNADRKEVILNTYELDLEGLDVVRLERDEEWFRCIFSNRRVKDLHPDSDVVIGPVANDTIYDTFGIITSGLIDEKTALRLLLEGPCYIQVALKSKRGAENLRWISSEKLKAEDAAVYRKILLSEEAEYQRKIAEIMKEN